MKALCIPTLKRGIPSCFVYDGISPNLDELAINYFHKLRLILDTHAPEVTRVVRDRPSAPWITDAIRDSRRQRRRAERCYRKKNSLAVHKDIYLKARYATSFQIQKSREQYHASKISDSGNKQLFTVTNELMGRTKSTPLPNNCPRVDLPQRFAGFFTDKISSLRTNLDLRACDPPEFSVYSGPKLDTFHPVSEDIIEEIIKSMPSKSCSLDLIPSSIVKQCLPEL